MLSEAECNQREVGKYENIKCIQCQKEINEGEFTWHTEIKRAKEFCSQDCYQTYETKLEELRKK